MESFLQVWDSICEYCKEAGNLTDIAYNTWVKRIVPNSINFGTATIILQVPTELHKNLLITSYNHLFNDACVAILGSPFNIEYLVADEQAPKQEAAPKIKSDDYDFTFDTFIVGSSNKFAHAAAQAVAENLAVMYNPLFIHGNPGLGKTHLLYAIMNSVTDRNPNAKIVYVKGDDFTNEMIEAIRQGTTPAFREKYRKADILLVDDIQFISGKESTEEEFFNTFNELYDNKKQIVIISDRPPKDITGISDRMRSRFEAGLMADIQNPEYETRVGIINRKAQMMNFNLSEEIVTYIADQVKCNIRQLEGVVKKLHAMSMIYDSITLGVAESVIRDIKREDISEPVTIQRVVNEVSKAYSVTIEDIYSKRQDAPVAHARQVAMYVIRQITEMPYKMIGQEFGGKNHATVMYSCNNIQKLCMTDDYESKLIANIIKNLTNK